MTTVEKIHHEFNTAGEAILKEAKLIIDESLLHKATRLENAGFSQSAEVKKASRMKMSKQSADAVTGYALRYPEQKFITEAQVKEICKKYNLKCAPLSRYTGFVPAEKLALIENFSVYDYDIPPNVVKIRSAWNNTSWLLGARTLRKRMGAEFIPVNDSRLFWMGDRLFSADESYVERWSVYDKSSRLICAPAKDINFRGLGKVGSFLTNYTTHYEPDPVVLQPVHGGYLILAAWGDEASDPIVVNQNHN